MDDARRILVELKQREWVDPELDFNEVMEGLAAGRQAASLIARDRNQASYLVRFSPGDDQLLKELTAIARAPFLAMAWPDPPNVDLDRIIIDFERTTNRRLELEWRWEQHPHDGFWICDYTVDGADAGGIGEGWDDRDSEENLVRLVDRLVGDSLSAVIWGGWPLCPRHPSRPMWPKKNSEGLASWICEEDPADQTQIGHLRA